MTTNNNNNESTFINSIIKQLEDYYGLDYDNSLKTSIYASIFNSAIFENMEYKYFKVKHKGQIVEGKLGNISISDLIAVREKHSQTKFTEEDWENSLLSISDDLTYCEESHIIYKGIDSEIRDWLIENKGSDIMHRLACSMIILPKLRGETVKIYDTFIKKEKDIYNKRFMLAESGINLDDDLWVIRYIEDLYTNCDATSTTSKIIMQYARDYNIVYEDLSYRFGHRMPMSNAIKLGEHESKQYGFKYITDASNINFLNYLKYYIKNNQ